MLNLTSCNELQPQRIAGTPPHETTGLRACGYDQEQEAGYPATFTHYNTRRMGHIESLHTSSNILAHTFVGRLNERVMAAVCVAMNENGKMVAPVELMEKNRQADLVFARSTCMLILWGHYGHGCTAVSKVYNMNHASVIYARSKAVARIEQEGWCGRVYIVACHLLGIEPLDFIHPKLVDKPVEHVYARSNKFQKKPGVKYVNPDAGITPTENWTAEELARRKIISKWPGSVPRDVILNFEKKFGVEL